jgi:hypothetical protein
MTTTTLDQPAVRYPNPQHVVHAVIECARCYYIGRVEWLPDGMVRVLHRGQYGNTVCLIRVPSITNLSPGGRALLLLR